MSAHSFLYLERTSSYALTRSCSLSFRLSYAFFHSCSGRLCGTLGVAVVSGTGGIVDWVGGLATGCGVGDPGRWAVEDIGGWSGWEATGRNVGEAGIWAGKCAAGSFEDVVGVDWVAGCVTEETAGWVVENVVDGAVDDTVG